MSTMRQFGSVARIVAPMTGVVIALCPVRSGANGGDSWCDAPPKGGVRICEGPPPSTALKRFAVVDLQFVQSVRFADGVYVAKVRDANGLMHSMMVGDPVGEGGHVISEINDREIVLRAGAPNKEGRVTNEVVRKTFEREALRRR